MVFLNLIRSSILLVSSFNLQPLPRGLCLLGPFTYHILYLIYRSFSEGNAFRVTAQDKITMFQAYAGNIPSISLACFVIVDVKKKFHDLCF